MSYATRDGKDTVVFVDKEYVDSQQEEIVPPSQMEDTTAAGKEKDQSSAYDPETGEINWDCPCLGGMAQGPCGEQFKAAFSCFVYSEAEPKGVDCVEKFKSMQDCFREHPDIYGDEIDDEDDNDAEQSEQNDQVTVSSAFEQGDDDAPTSWFSSWFS